MFTGGSLLSRLMNSFALSFMVLTSGCIAARADLGSVAAFDLGQPAHPEGHANLDLGLSLGFVTVTTGLHTRPSAKGVEFNVVPQGCLTVPLVTTNFAFGGCLGVTALGAGTRERRATLLIGGTAMEAYIMTPFDRDLDWERAKKLDREALFFLRAGIRSGVDIRAGDQAFLTPYVGAFAGVEMWIAPW